jgi:hypothetical protein
MPLTDDALAVLTDCYFGRDELGQVLRDALEVAFPAGAVADVEEREQVMEALDEASYERLEQLEATYNALVLEDMFRQRLRESPRDFARLETTSARRCTTSRRGYSWATDARGWRYPLPRSSATAAGSRTDSPPASP